MIATDKRKAIFLIHQEGMSVKEIARRLGVSRNTARAIIGRHGFTRNGGTGGRRIIDQRVAGGKRTRDFR